MTVCIAVTPRFTTSIVVATDTLLSSDINSARGEPKFTRLSPKLPWIVMFAGASHRFRPIVEGMREHLGDGESPRLAVETVVNSAEHTYQRELEGLVNAEVLAPYGLSRREFIENGLKWFGEARYGQLLAQINELDLGIELLVAGLDGYAQTQMFAVSSRGVVERMALPYHAIGSGAYLALGTLYQLAHFPGPDLAETVYRVCAAKFAAEAAPGVGAETHLMVFDFLLGTWTWLLDPDRVREIWRSRGQPPFPAAAKSLISPNLRALRPKAHPRKPRRRPGTP